MNIQLQLAGLAVMLMLAYFCLKQRSLWMRTEKVFMWTMGISIVCVFLDVLSIVAIVYRQYISEFALSVVCKTYLISIVGVGYSSLVYTNTDLIRENKFRYRRVVAEIVAFIAISLIYALPIRYYHQGNKIYTYGPSVVATYVFAVFCVFMTMFKVICNKKTMPKKRANAIRNWMVLWIIAALIQVTHNELLVVGFATALGMLILFFELENPEANIDRETGLFNFHALYKFVQLKIDRGEFFCGIMVSINPYQKNGEGKVNLLGIMDEMTDFLEMESKARLFKGIDCSFVMIFDTYGNIEEVLPKIRERFNYPWQDMIKQQPVTVDVLFSILPDGYIFRSAKEIFTYFERYKLWDDYHYGNNVVYIEEKSIREIRERDEMERRLLEAMDEDRVELFYQPIYSIEERKFVSAEALVRIREKNGNIVSPVKFISVAEETGSIVKLGKIIFDKTCRMIKENNIRQYGVHYIESNLSVRQCESTVLADEYLKIIKKYEIDPTCINLEITETASIRARRILLRNMRKLMEYGVHFSLDDFGNGESNLNYIVDMPIAIVKFDREMVQSFFKNKKTEYIMRAVRDMVHSFGLKIVAEGVESREQLEVFEQFGIDYIQGYYFSKPLPEDEFIQFIAHQKIN